jgi:DNA polymerase I-like protein with 3'-5' exonuclease and polymerase domains
MTPTTIVNYRHTTNAFIAKRYLEELSTHPIIAWDFEVAVKYTDSDVARMKTILEQPDLPRNERITIEAALSATALDHPSHTVITHCSIAWSETDSIVFVLANKAITNLVLNYLVTTKQKQIVHNATYDFKHLYYHTGKFPYDYEDTRLLAKTLVNHVDTHKARVGLKELAGHRYGDWGIDSTQFTLAHMHDSKMIKYAAIDSAATFWLWNYMQTRCDELDQQKEQS